MTLTFSPDGGPVSGLIQYQGRTTWTISPGQVIWVTLNVDLAISGSLKAGVLSGTASGRTRSTTPRPLAR